MSFNRSQAQVYLEQLAKCESYDDFRKVPPNKVSLNLASADQLKIHLRNDAIATYFKAIVSLLEGLDGIKSGNFSWAVVKLYYSIFYNLKTELALKGFGLIRHKGLCICEAIDGSVLKKFNEMERLRGLKQSDFSGDHNATVNFFIHYFRDSDILLSQEIEGIETYTWIMKKREQVNYKEINFNEPDPPLFLNYIANKVIYGGFNSLIEEIISDDYVLTFQCEYAPIAIPIKRAILTNKSFIDSDIAPTPSLKQYAYLSKYESHFLLNSLT